VLSFKDFIVVDYTQTGDELLAYQAQKRHRGVVGEETTDEALSFAGRRALGRAMKRRQAVLKKSRARAMQKVAGQDVLMKRAEKQARNIIFQKLSKDTPRGELTPQRRAEIEAKVAKAKTRVQALARKLLPKLRQAAKDRKK
jgi:hypothetical protein